MSSYLCYYSSMTFFGQHINADENALMSAGFAMQSVKDTSCAVMSEHMAQQCFREPAVVAQHVAQQSAEKLNNFEVHYL